MILKIINIYFPDSDEICMAENSIITELIEKFSSESRFVREDAAYALSMTVSEDAVTALVRGLSDPVPQIRAMCAKFLGKNGRNFSAAVTPELIKALHDNDATVARNAATALGFLGDKDAVEPLIGLLKHENPQVRLYSVLALGRLGDERSLLPMLSLLRDDHDKKIRATIIMALGFFTNPKLLPVIMKFGLSDADPRVRASAVESISRLDPPLESVMEPLRKLLDDDNNRVAANTCLALWKAGDLSVMDHIIRLVKHHEKFHRASGAYVLGKIANAEAVNLLVSMKGDPAPEVRINVVRSLMSVKNAKALPVIVEMLDDEDRMVRDAALGWLLKCADKYAFWPMIQYLKSPHESIRFIAFRALVNIDDPAAIQYLEEAAASEKNNEMRQQMKKYLGIFRERHPDAAGKPHKKDTHAGIIAQSAPKFNESNELPENTSEKTLVDKIIEQLGQKSQFLREEAAYELSYVNSEKAVMALVKGLSDATPKVRAVCAKSLAKHGWHHAKAVTPPLIEALYDDNSEVAQSAAYTLGYIRDSSAVPALIEILYHDNPNTRLYAAMALGRMNDQAALKPLLELLQRDHNKKVRSTVLVALGNFAVPKTLPLIVKFGLSDNDPHVRASAVEAISKLGLSRDEALGHLLKMFSDQNNRVVANTCLAVFRYDETLAMNNVNKLIKNPDKWYRASGAYVLGKIGTVEAMNMLMPLKNDHDPDVRLNVARSFGKAKSAKAITTLFEMLDDSDELVKNTAYDSIIKCSDKFAFWPMAQNLKSPHEVIRFLATVVLVNIDDPAAIPMILETLSRELNPEVRAEMVKYLTLLSNRHLDTAFKDVFSENQKNSAVMEEGLKLVAGLDMKRDARKALYEIAMKAPFKKVAAEAEKLFNAI